MKLKSLVIIIIAIAIGAVVYYLETRPRLGPDGVNSLLIPNLSQHLNDITNLTITGANNTLLAKVSKSDEYWVVENKDGYIADIVVVRNAFQNLAEAKLIEAKTSNPENYSKLGVEAISKSSAQGVQVKIGGLGEEIKFIAGSKGNAGDDSQYIRFVDVKQSWLINKNLNLDKEAVNWLKKDLLDIPPERIKSINIKHAESLEIDLENKGSDKFEFVLLNTLPEGQKVSESDIYQVANTLSSLQLADVVLEENVNKESAQHVITTFETFDGLIIKANSYIADERTLTTFIIKFDVNLVDESKVMSQDEQGGSDAIVRSDPEAAKQMANEMSPNLSGWAYELPTIVQEALVKKIENFVLAEET